MTRIATGISSARGIAPATRAAFPASSRSSTTSKRSAAEPLLADIFVPDLRVRGDIVAEQFLALPRFQVHDFHAAFAQPVDAALEGARLAHHHRADLELHHQPAAVPAGCER